MGYKASEGKVVLFLFLRGEMRKKDKWLQMAEYVLDLSFFGFGMNKENHLREWIPAFVIYLSGSYLFGLKSLFRLHILF